MSELRIEKVKWLDHCTAGRGTTWKELNQVMSLEPIIVETVGWIFKETEEYIIIASTVSNDDGLMGELLILKSDIQSRKVLK